jgi:hypothetical protein
VAATALVGVGVALTRGSDGSDGSGRADGADAADAESGESASGAEMEVSDAKDVSAEYADAVVRLGEAHTFRYTGTVRAEGPSVLRPVHDAGSDDTISVDGAIQLPLSITHEYAADEGGEITETLTTRTSARSRSAPDGPLLRSATWTTTPGFHQEDVRMPLPAVPGGRLGMALLANILRTAGDRREAPPDDAGRRVLRATVPDRVPSDAVLSELLAGAEVAIVVDDGGDIVHVTLESAPGHPVLDVDVDIAQHGDPGLVTGTDLNDPIASTVPADALAYVGLGSLDLPGLPSRWALTDAEVFHPDATFTRGPVDCGEQWLSLWYNDLTGVAEGWLNLFVFALTEGCVGLQDPGDSEAVTAGRFTGWVVDPLADQYGGTVTDGITMVAFHTDLPLDAATAAIASLAPAG